MLDTILSIFGIYLFIALGWFSKRLFGEQIDERTLVLVAVYFLSPILVFWGLTIRPMEFADLQAPLIFALVSIIALMISAWVSRRLFANQKSRSIATVAAIIGNTGNLGIPLGIALFGEASIFYTSVINLVNVFIVNTIGVYFYARGEFSSQKALRAILSLPAIWFGFLGLGFNLFGVRVPDAIDQSLEMGAYASMVIQLFIFGAYLHGVVFRQIDYPLAWYVAVSKFIVMPILAFGVLSLFGLEPLVYHVILLELVMPLAIMNVNLAALYHCKVNQVAFLTFGTSILFLVYLFFLLPFLRAD